MKVFVVYDDAPVKIAGCDDEVMLDLVAHFVGMAEQHNDNAAPAANAVDVPQPRKVIGASAPPSPVRFAERGILTAVRDTTLSEACIRAVDNLARTIRFTNHWKPKPLRLVVGKVDTEN